MNQDAVVEETPLLPGGHLLAAVEEIAGSLGTLPNLI